MRSTSNKLNNSSQSAPKDKIVSNKGSSVPVLSQKYDTSAQIISSVIDYTLNKDLSEKLFSHFNNDSDKIKEFLCAVTLWSQHPKSTYCSNMAPLTVQEAKDKLRLVSVSENHFSEWKITNPFKSSFLYLGSRYNVLYQDGIVCLDHEWDNERCTKYIVDMIKPSTLQLVLTFLNQWLTMNNDKVTAEVFRDPIKEFEIFGQFKYVLENNYESLFSLEGDSSEFYKEIMTIGARNFGHGDFDKARAFRKPLENFSKDILHLDAVFTNGPSVVDKWLDMAIIYRKAKIIRIGFGGIDNWDLAFDSNCHDIPKASLLDLTPSNFHDFIQIKQVVNVNDDEDVEHTTYSQKKICERS